MMITLVFKPEVFVFSDAEKHLLYNAVTYSHFELPHSPFWDILFSSIVTVTSLYRYSFPRSELEMNQTIITDICNRGFASISKEGESIPFSYAPIPKFDFDLKAIQLKHDIGEGREILSFLKTIIYYLSAEGTVEETHLQKHAEKLKYCPIGRVEVHLFHPQSESLFASFIASLENLFHNVHFYLYASSWKEKEIDCFFAHHKWANNHIVGSIDDALYLTRRFPSIIEVDSPNALKIATEAGAEQVLIKYNGNNLSFLRDVLFTRESDLYSSSKRDIFIRQTLNSNYFGRLIVDVDGTVKAGLYGENLGTMDSPLYTIIYRELTRKNSLWMLHRGKTECNDCRFKYLCPCISDYELSLKDYRLCWRNHALL